MLTDPAERYSAKDVLHRLREVAAHGLPGIPRFVPVHAYSSLRAASRSASSRFSPSSYRLGQRVGYAGEAAERGALHAREGLGHPAWL
jgi:hypothetical protein